MTTNNRRYARHQNSSNVNMRIVSHDYKCKKMRQLAKDNPSLSKILNFFGTKYTNRLFGCVPPVNISKLDLEEMWSNALQITVNTCSPFRAPQCNAGKCKWRLISLDEGYNIPLHQPDFWNENLEQFKEASQEAPKFRSWSSSKYNHPSQKNGKYYFGTKARTVTTIELFLQYLAIINDLILEIFHNCSDEAIDNLNKCVLCLKNFMYSKRCYDIKRLNEIALIQIAEKIATLLLTRDSPDLSKGRNDAIEFDKTINSLHPLDYLCIWRLIAIGAVTVKNKDGQYIDSNQLYDRSLFRDADLILLGTFLEENCAGILEGFMVTANCRIISDSFRHVPAINVKGITDLDKMVEKLLTEAGKATETSLRRNLFVVDMLRYWMIHPQMKISKTHQIINTIRERALKIKGIVPLIIALYPHASTYSGLDATMAEAIYIAGQGRSNKRRMVDPRILAAHCTPTLLLDMIDKEIRYIKNLQDNMDNLKITHVREENAVLVQSNDRILVESDPILARSYVTDKYFKEYKGRNTRHSASGASVCNFHQTIASYAYDKNYHVVLSFYKGTENDCSYGGPKTVCTLVRHIWERMFHKNEMTFNELNQCFTALSMPRKWSKDSACIQKVRDNRKCRAMYYAVTMLNMNCNIALVKQRENKVVFNSRVAIEDEIIDTSPISFITLDQCIEKQTMQCIQMSNIINEALQYITCSICMDVYNKHDMEVMHIHTNDPLCKSCLAKATLCYFCRAPRQQW